MDTHVFYPTYAQTLTHLSHSRFDQGDVANDAQPIAGQHPLILMSHGSTGTIQQMLWLVEPLVKAGFVVASVNHHGNTHAEPELHPNGQLHWWARAGDFHWLLQRLQQDPKWSQRIDFKNLALVGFSLGGYTVTSLLGGITDVANLIRYCQSHPAHFTCQEPKQEAQAAAQLKTKASERAAQQSWALMKQSYRLNNVKAAVLIAPALITSFEAASLQQIKTPTLAIIGTDDDIIAAKDNANLLQDHLENLQLTWLPKVTHFSFLSRCTTMGRLLPDRQGLCADHPSIDRTLVHQETGQQILNYLQARGL
jgi:predicted dienelactone hydrolase